MILLFLVLTKKPTVCAFLIHSLSNQLNALNGVRGYNELIVVGLGVEFFPLQTYFNFQLLGLLSSAGESTSIVWFGGQHGKRTS